MSVTIGITQWAVDVGGVATSTVPGTAAVTTQQPSDRLDKEIEKVTSEKDRQASISTNALVKVAELTQQETDLIALRATVTAEP